LVELNGLPEQSKIWEHVVHPDLCDDVPSRVGNLPAALDSAPRKLQATYDFAIHTGDA
jgi:hypothetical protein